MVVVIIAVLLAMLLPMLNRAKKTVRFSVCINNQKELVAATYLYTIDNDDRLPYCNSAQIERENDGVIAGWLYDSSVGKTEPEHVESSSLFQYIESRQIYFCPSDSETDRLGTNKLTSYSTNAVVNGFATRVLPFSINQMSSDGIYLFGQDNEDGWNDGSNYADEIGDESLPIPERLPDRHDKQTSVSYFDGSVHRWDGDQWADTEDEEPGQFYCMPGKSNGRR